MSGCLLTDISNTKGETSEEVLHEKAGKVVSWPMTNSNGINREHSVKCQVGNIGFRV